MHSNIVIIIRKISDLPWMALVAPSLT